ncbi:hypothetical protein HY633_01495, partial [Candidatus Uhrbacteria bacterium]|nr:hypothetical protein [Candidatus Uhrbacteria bacterium]
MKEPALQPPIAPEANDALEKIRRFVEFSAACEEELASLLEQAGISVDKKAAQRLRNLTWVESEHRFSSGRPGAVVAARCTDGKKDAWTVVRKQFREEEWLGYQLDRVFDVRRHAATVMRDVGGLPSSMSELLEGQNGMMFDWSKDASDAEIARLADYHY